MAANKAIASVKSCRLLSQPQNTVRSSGTTSFWSLALSPVVARNRAVTKLEGSEAALTLTDALDLDGSTPSAQTCVNAWAAMPRPRSLTRRRRSPAPTTRPNATSYSAAVEGAHPSMTPRPASCRLRDERACALMRGSLSQGTTRGRPRRRRTRSCFPRRSKRARAPHTCANFRARPLRRSGTSQCAPRVAALLGTASRAGSLPAKLAEPFGESSEIFR